MEDEKGWRAEQKKRRQALMDDLAKLLRKAGNDVASMTVGKDPYNDDDVVYVDMKWGKTYRACIEADADATCIYDVLKQIPALWN